MPAVLSAGKPPRFSVIIPTYRRAELLAEALASVVAQTFSDFEIIVVDDDPAASANDSVTEFAKRHPAINLQYHRNDHARGGSGTRNAGIERASGEWVAFLDDDDTWLPEKLGRVDKLIADNVDPRLALVYTGHVKYDFEEQREIPAFTPSVRGMALERVLYENVVGGMSVVVARTSLLQELGGFDERFESLQDMELYVRLAERGSFDFVQQPLVRIRSSSRERITHNPQKKLQGARLFAQKYAAQLSRDPRLKHRAASRIFVFALAARDYGEVLRNSPWTLAGLVVDPANLIYVFKSMLRQVKAFGVTTVKTVRAPAR